MRLYATVLVVSLSIASTSLQAAVPVHQWSKRFGNTGSGDNLGAVAVDALGNVIIVGPFTGTVDFGGGPLTSAGIFDVYVAKYTPGGIHVWSARYGGSGPDQPLDVAVDAANNIVVTGTYTGPSANFGGASFASVSGSPDMFLAKYDPSGVHLWSYSFGDTAADNGRTVSVDGSGNIFVGGNFLNYAAGSGPSVGGAPLSSNSTAGGGDFFIAKYDASGSHLWSQSWGGTGDDFSAEIATDGSGNAVITGIFATTVDFGGGPIVSVDADIFVARYDAGGSHLWSKGFGGTGDDMGNAVAADAVGNTYVTGYISGTVDFGGGGLISAGGPDIFFAKFDAAGAHQWSQRFGSTGNDVGRGLTLTGAGNILLTGSFNGSVDFGGGPFTGAGGLDAFVAQYSANGDYQCGRRFGGTSTDIGRSVGAGPSGTINVGGTFFGAVDFGGGPLTSAGSQDIFLTQYTCEDPIPVLISSFEASHAGGGVELRWKLWSDEFGASYVLLRRENSNPYAVEIASGPLHGDAGSYVDESVSPGASYSYQLLVRTLDGSEVRSPEVSIGLASLEVSLSQNVPNPFNPSTEIEYTVRDGARVVLGIYDASGALVTRLDEGFRQPGRYRVAWNGRDEQGRLAGSGVYFYRIEGNGKVGSRKMVLLK